MRFTDENAVLALLLEARVLDDASCRAERREHVRRAMAVLGAREWTRAEALAAVGLRRPCWGTRGRAIGHSRVAGLSKVGAGRLLR